MPLTVDAQQFDIEAIKAKAATGDSSAQNNLGICYATGRGVEKDPAQAMKWWQQAADQGNALALINLGVCYEEGDGVSQDSAQAYVWYAVAAASGNQSAAQAMELVAAKLTPEQLKEAQGKAEKLLAEIQAKRDAD
jgi:TPR repeat protein